MPRPVDIQTNACRLSEHMRMDVPATAAQSFVADQVAAKPSMKELFRKYCLRAGVPRRVVRVRAARLFSTVGILWDVAGAVPAQASAPFFMIPLGQPDPVLGQMTRLHTNQTEAGRSDAQTSFVLKKVGLAIGILAPGDSATIPELGTVTAAAYEAVGWTWNTGREIFQIMGSSGFYNEPAALISPFQQVIAPNAESLSIPRMAGYHYMVRLDPPLVIGPGESYNATCDIDVGRIPGGASLANASAWIRLDFFGVSRTGIQG